MKYVYAGHDGFIEAVQFRFAEAGFERVTDVRDAEAVLTYCVSQTALEDAYFDTCGFIQAAKPGTLLVDLSASTPNFARELNAVAMVSDLLFVEAPLVVGDMMRADAFADRDNLRCYVAGEDDAVERACEILKPLVSEVQVTGAVGSAQLARAAHTLQVCARTVAAIEGEALCRAVSRSLAGGFSSSFDRPMTVDGAEASLLDAVSIGAFSGTYTVEMLMAELSAALMTADDAELILPQAEAVMHLLELLAVIGGSQKAPSALALVYGEEADCAAQGLDWTRAEQAFAHDGCGFEDYDGFEGYDDCDDDCDCGCGHDHGHGHDRFYYSDN